MSDTLTRALRTLDSFDAERWAGQLAEAQEQTAQALATWEQTEAQRFSAEGQQMERERLAAPEQQARARALQEAEAALAEVQRAQALLIDDDGLTAAERQKANERRADIEALAASLPSDTLAQRIAASARLGDKAACSLWVLYAGRRLGQLQEDLEAAGDNPVLRARARGAIEVLRPVLQQAQSALESSTIADLRAKVAEVERQASQLKARALVAPAAAVLAAKRRDSAYSL